MTVFIPAKVRGIVYTIFALIGLALGGAQVGYSAAETSQPLWLKVALAVFAFVGGAIGYTAASNTPAAPSAQVSEPIPDPGDLESPDAFAPDVDGSAPSAPPAA
jgi:protein-S-isoprenylcysteine O-methyltransferase Ste14